MLPHTRKALQHRVPWPMKRGHMETVRFYTEGKYMGWQSVKNTTRSEVKSWIRSGNEIRIGNKTYNDPNHTDLQKLK